MSLSVENLSAAYGNIRVLWDVSIKVEKGKIITLIGANGAGKSTLLKCIMGIVKFQNGRISLNGHSLAKMKPHTIVASGIGYVPEGRRLFSQMSVYENLRMGAPRNCDDLDSRIELVFDLFPALRERRKQIAGTLSGGEQQMVAIGRALMNRPELLILDELSFGLAPKVFEKVIETIREINQKGVSILMAEQNAERALEISEFGYVLENGRIVIDGLCRDLINNEKVRTAYLGV
jgi:branched-chain amino acid transport system ATP-binding protein